MDNLEHVINYSANELKLFYKKIGEAGQDGEGREDTVDMFVLFFLFMFFFVLILDVFNEIKRLVMTEVWYIVYHFLLFKEYKFIIFEIN